MMKTNAIAVILFSSFVLAVACGDSSSPTSGSSPMTTTTGTPTSTVLANPSFATDIQGIFNRNGCTDGACHGTATSANLDLRAGASYNALVNVRATSEPINRVIPGNADGSYLVIKLEGRQSVGSRMPFGGQPINDTDLTNIKNWINQGANNN